MYNCEGGEVQFCMLTCVYHSRGRPGINTHVFFVLALRGIACAGDRVCTPRAPLSTSNSRMSFEFFVGVLVSVLAQKSLA